MYRTFIRLCASLRIRLDSFWVSSHLRKLGVSLGDNSSFVGAPIVTLYKGAAIEIGANGMFLSKSYATALGVCHPIVLRTMLPGAKILIGPEVGMSGASLCAAKSITIGKSCLLGADVIITDSDFHPLDPELRRDAKQAFEAAMPVHIGENVFLGARVIVLKGGSIGDNSVIGAGSVVTGPIPANVIAAGNPCKIIRAIAAAEIS